MPRSSSWRVAAATPWPPCRSCGTTSAVRGCVSAHASHSGAVGPIAHPGPAPRPSSTRSTPAVVLPRQATDPRPGRVRVTDAHRSRAGHTRRLCIHFRGLMVSADVPAAPLRGSSTRLQHVRFGDIPRADWDRLYSVSPGATPFSSWTFHRAWWDAFAATAEEHYLVLEAERDHRHRSSHGAPGTRPEARRLGLDLLPDCWPGSQRPRHPVAPHTLLRSLVPR